VNPGLLFSAIGKRGAVPSHSMRIKYNSKIKQSWFKKDFAVNKLAEPWKIQRTEALKITNLNITSGLIFNWKFGVSKIIILAAQ